MTPSFRDEPNPYEPPVVATLVERPKPPKKPPPPIWFQIIRATVVALLIFFVFALIFNGLLYLAFLHYQSVPHL